MSRNRTHTITMREPTEEIPIWIQKDIIPATTTRTGRGLITWLLRNWMRFANKSIKTTIKASHNRIGTSRIGTSRIEVRLHSINLSTHWLMTIHLPLIPMNKITMSLWIWIMSWVSTWIIICMSTMRICWTRIGSTLQQVLPFTISKVKSWSFDSTPHNLVQLAMPPFTSSTITTSTPKWVRISLRVRIAIPAVSSLRRIYKMRSPKFRIV
jgi:hypothetical protein